MTRPVSRLLLCLTLLLCAPAAAAETLYTPSRGTAERSAILNTLRPSVEALLNPPVEFVVRTMNVSNGWAFIAVKPQRPGGGQIDVRKTRIKDWDVMDGLTTYALLKFQSGRWNLIEKIVGPTDVAWEAWPKLFGAPRIIFGLPQ